MLLHGFHWKMTNTTQCLNDGDDYDNDNVDDDDEEEDGNEMLICDDDDKVSPFHSR